MGSDSQGDLPRMGGGGGLMSLDFEVFTRLTGCSGGLIVSGGETMDVLGLGRLRLARFVGAGGGGGDESVTTIASGSSTGDSGTGEAFFSWRADRFFVEVVLDVT